MPYAAAAAAAAASHVQLSNCPHLAVSVGFMSAPDLRAHVSVARCDHCEGGPDGLWLCLYPDCYMLGCSEGPKDHSSLHNRRNERHCVQLNIDSRRVWCYKCNAEVEVYGDPSRLFGALLPAPKDGGVRLPEDRQDVDAKTAGLVGLTNLGNTCYMNAALQCLLNIPALTEFFSACPALVHKAEKNAMSKAFGKLAEDVWRRQGGPQQQRSFLSPTGVLYALKAAYPKFRGFHQHDSQEFLRCILDQLHEELLEPIATDNGGELGEDDNLDSVSEVGSAAGGSPVGSDGEGDPEEYETADSGVSEQSSTCSETGAATAVAAAATAAAAAASAKGSRKRKMSRASSSSAVAIAAAQEGKREKEEDPVCSAGGDTGGNGGGNAMASDGELDFADAASDVVSSHSGSPPLSSSPPLGHARSLATRTGRAGSATTMLMHKRRPTVYRSVISDIFDGKLVSSVQCLSCDRVSTTTEIFQDLSLPIPTQDVLATVLNQQPGGGADMAGGGGGSWVSWVYNWVSGWFYGPNITLIDCLSYFFSADELKGDNMYSCERCKKLRNGLKYYRVTVLPDTLCIHLKRFRHEFAFSSKISTKVTFPMTDLDMSPWLHKDSYSNASLFDLTGVICHHGSAGGGHYTAYALNPVSQEWYEFDDSTVTKVEPATVLNSEAYVLFYRKNSMQSEQMRI